MVEVTAVKLTETAVKLLEIRFRTISCDTFGRACVCAVCFTSQLPEKPIGQLLNNRSKTN